MSERLIPEPNRYRHSYGPGPSDAAVDAYEWTRQLHRWWWGDDPWPRYEPHHTMGLRPGADVAQSFKEVAHGYGLAKGGWSTELGPDWQPPPAMFGPTLWFTVRAPTRWERVLRRLHLLDAWHRLRNPPNPNP